MSGEEPAELIPEPVEFVGYASLANRFGLGMGRYVGRCCGVGRACIPTVEDDISSPAEGLSGGGGLGEPNGLGPGVYDPMDPVFSVSVDLASPNSTRPPKDGSQKRVRIIHVRKTDLAP
jgi:hypothetical protein